MALDNSASHSSDIFIVQFERKPPESCQKDATNLSKTDKKLYQVTTVRCIQGCKHFSFVDCLSNVPSGLLGELLLQQSLLSLLHSSSAAHVQYIITCI